MNIPVAHYASQIHAVSFLFNLCDGFVTHGIILQSQQISEKMALKLELKNNSTNVYCILCWIGGWAGRGVLLS